MAKQSQVFFKNSCLSSTNVFAIQGPAVAISSHVSRVISPGHHTFKGNTVRVAFVVAAMLFCAPVFAQGLKLKSFTNSIGIELIEIPAGKFTMGSPETEKDRYDHHEAQVSVTLTKSYGLGKTEVTQGQWKSVMGSEPWDGEDFVKADKECPATHVSWDDATEFCEELTKLEREAGKLKVDEEYRLPTEAQWEYACRAGTTTAFSFGDDESKLGEYAWWGGVDLVAAAKGEAKAGPGNAAREQYAHKVGLSLWSLGRCCQ